MIQKTAAGEEDEYTTGCLLDYLYFKNRYNMIAINKSLMISCGKCNNLEQIKDKIQKLLKSKKS